MAEKDSAKPESTESSEYMRGGKGRKDEVGGSGIYPASSPNAPGDAEIRGQGELGHPNTSRRPIGTPEEIPPTSPIRPTD
jgi:hypothetical protein